MTRRFELVDISGMANPPHDPPPAGNDIDFRLAVAVLSHDLRRIGRTVVPDNDRADAFQSRLKAAAVAEHLDVKSLHAGTVVHFYVNGPRPHEFIRQFRDSHMRSHAR